MPKQHNGVTFLSFDEVRDRIGFDPYGLNHFDHEQTFFYRGLAEIREQRETSHGANTVFVQGFFYSSMASGEWIKLRFDGVDFVENAVPCCALVDKEHVTIESFYNASRDIGARYAVRILEPVDGPTYFRESYLLAEMERLGITHPVSAASQGSDDQRASKSLSTRERKSLLRILKTLALAKGYTAEKPHKDAEGIAALGTAHKTTLPSAETIAKYLEEARDVD